MTGAGIAMAEPALQSLANYHRVIKSGRPAVTQSVLCSLGDLKERFEVTQAKIDRICRSTRYMAPPEDHVAFAIGIQQGAEYQTRLQQLVQDVNVGYARWLTGRKGTTLFHRLQKVASLSAARPVVSYEEFKRYPGAMNALFKSYEILYSPTYLARLSEGMGADSLWWNTAHEIGHLLSIRRSDFAIEPADLHLRMGAHSLKTCTPALLKITKEEMALDPLLQREIVGDLLAVGAMGFALDDKAAPANWLAFIEGNVDTLCSSYYVKHDHAKMAPSQNYWHTGHPRQTFRINAIMANNRIRANLGCQPFPREFTCHDWD